MQLHEERKAKTREDGSALIFIIILMVTVGGLVTAHLGELNSEKRKIQTLINTQRATDRARGELERAKNLVNAAPYTNDHNTALWAAIHADPPYIPGTEVIVQRVGDPTSEWYMLRATGQFQGMTKSAQVFVRERSPFTSYNLFVLDHPVGISGTPRGHIHTNERVDFMFPWGTYRDEITAVKGFDYKAGATPENTRIWGPANPNSAAMNDVLTGVAVPGLKDQANTLAVTDNLIAKVELQGKNTKVDMWSPQTTTMVSRTKTVKKFKSYKSENKQIRQRKYKVVPYQVQVPTFKTITEHVKRRRKVFTWKNVTESVRRPVYKNIKETYQELVPVWKTRLVKRQSFEKTWFDANVDTAAKQLSTLRADFVGLRNFNPKLSGWFKMNILWIDKAIRGIDAKPPEWNKARHIVKSFAGIYFRIARRHKHRSTTLKNQSGGTEKMYDLCTALANRFVGIATQIDADEKRSGEVLHEGAEFGPSVEALEQLGASAGSRNVSTGFVSVQAVTEYTEEPYIASTKTVTKTRIRRVKTGEKVTSVKRRVRKFSHMEEKLVSRKRRVRTGWTTASRNRRVFDGWETVQVTVQVPQFSSENVTILEPVVVPASLVQSYTVPTEGTVYIEKDIAEIFGQVNGRMSIVSNGKVRITNSITYVDDAGQQRMKNGLDPNEPYEFNPDYDGESVLLLIASGDIIYDKVLPKHVEVNCSMLTTQGKVAMQGLVVSSDGNEVTLDDEVGTNPNDYVKTSLRRLGGIIARKRPVATYVDSKNKVVAGFEKGVSHMDRELVIEDGGTVLPPAVFQLNRPTWALHAVGKHIDVAQ